MAERTSEPRGAFVLSTGRCASTFLSTLLRAHPQVLSLSEFFSMLGGARLLSLGEVSGEELWAYLETPQIDLTAVLRSGPVPELLAAQRARPAACANLAPPLLITLPHLYDEPARLFSELGNTVRAAPRAPVVNHLRRLFALLSERFARGTWVERSGGSAEYAPELLHAFPDARAIFLLRDGIESALSMSKHPLFRWRVAELTYKAPRSDEVPIEAFGTYWSASVQRAQRAFLQAKEAMVLRYEDLVAHTARELERVAAFLDLEPAHNQRWLAACRAFMPTQPRVSTSSAVAADVRARLERSCRVGQRCLDRFVERRP